VRDCQRHGPQQARRPPLTPDNVAPDLRIRVALGGARTPNLLIRRFLGDRPAPFRSVRDLGLVPLRYPAGSEVSEGCSSVWLPAWLPPDVRCQPEGRLATWARALRELIGAALRAPAEALYLLGSCLDVPPSGSKATRSIGARPATGRTEGHGRHPSYPAACDSPGHSPRVATRSARPLPLAREQPDAHLLIVHPRQPPVKGLASLRPCDLLIRRSGQVVQDRPLRPVRWGDNPGLSIRGRRCLPPRQHVRQQRAWCRFPRDRPHLAGDGPRPVPGRL
jgi:hypothetical protein